jgi:ATPase subunit of ABC transporter with duplicated ATPase domains
MDAEAKEQFSEWMKSQKTAMLIVTHDRDVLDQVDRILELRDKSLLSFPGNYSSYIHQNKTSSVTDMAQYEVALKTLENLHKQIQSVRAKKASTGKTPNPFIPLERRLMKQYEELKESTKKPSFWIDSESHKDLKKADQERYAEYKAASIRIGSHASKAKHAGGSLMQAHKVVLGYDAPLFDAVTMSIKSGDRVRMLGRNGAGKSTLLKHILATYHQQQPESTLYSGELTIDKGCRIGVYEESALFSKTLATIRRDAPITFALPEKSWLETCSMESVEPILREFEFKSLIVRMKEVLSGGMLSSQETKQPSEEKVITPQVRIAMWLLNSDLTNPSMDDVYASTKESDPEKALPVLEKEIKEQGLETVYRSIELPLVPILQRMQEHGVLLDCAFLKNLSNELHAELAKCSPRS